MTEPSNVDVLVVGAGPAGLMCANALVHAGVSVRIVDKRAERIQAGHADGMHARTLEIFQSYGLAERLFRESEQIHRVAFYHRGPNGGIERVRRGPGFTAPTARFPFACSRHQGGIEAIFIDAMKEKGLHVERPTIPTSLELSEDPIQLKDPRAYPVQVTLKHLGSAGDDIEVVNAKFVVGADGAHSWVRKTMGIEMEGDQTDHIWGVIDFVPDTDFPDNRNLCFIQSPDGSALLIPRERDHVRVYVQLSDSDVIDPQTGRIDKDRTNPQRILEIAQAVFRPYRMAALGEVEWWTTYGVGQRYARKFSVHDRVLIAGDACHTHSPKGGQGMNASMADTHNLAWKLAFVIRGWADMSLLNTYEGERRKFAEELINFDREWAALFTESGSPTRSDQEAHVMFRKHDEFMSGIGVAYDPSPIVNTQWQACASKLPIGQRMVPHIFVSAADARPMNIHDRLLADARFKILVFVGDITLSATAERVSVLADRLAAPEHFLKRFERDEDRHTVFDILCISASSKDAVDYTDLPPILRTHWSKVLLDDIDMHGRSGGGGFAAYGIDPQEGAMVIVRPDGHVGMVAPCDRLEAVDAYFTSFMVPI